MSPNVTEITAPCVDCAVTVLLRFEPWGGDGPATAALWACPYCGAINTLQVIGRVVAALRVTDRLDTGT